MAFIDEGEVEAMKTPIGFRDPRCDNDQLCAKMTVSIQAVCQISLLNIVVVRRKNTKNGTFMTAHFCV